MADRVPPFDLTRRCRPAPLVSILVALTVLVAAPSIQQTWAQEAQVEASPSTRSTTPLASLESAESRFNQAARQRDRDSFRALLASDSVFLAGEVHSGRLAVLAIWQHLFDGKFDFRYEAESLNVRVADSGDIGWAVGAVRTSFTRPGATQPESTDGYYLHLWTRNEEGAWQLSYAASLVVHPSLGSSRDPRGGLMTAWPELADQIDAEIDLSWHPQIVQRAKSGELAFSFGEYEASFQPATPVDGALESVDPGSEPPVAKAAISGAGHYLAVWLKDSQGRWQLAGEGFTPPGIYGE